VNYGVSAPGTDLALYVMTRTHLQKARDIKANARVSLVVSIRRRFAWFLPPATIQIRGRAELLQGTGEAGTQVFRRFWIGRRILHAYDKSRQRGESRICFLKITPDPVVRTYMVGSNVWELNRRMEAGAASVVIPPDHDALGPSPRQKETTMRRNNQALFTLLLIAAAAIVAMPLLMGGTGMMGWGGIYPGMMGGYSAPTGSPTWPWGMAFGGAFMLVLWALAIAGAVLLVRWLTNTEQPSDEDVLRRRYAAGDLTRDQFEQMRGDLEPVAVARPDS